MNTVLKQFIGNLSALGDITDVALVGGFLQHRLPPVLRCRHLLDGVDICADIKHGYNKITLHTHTGKNPWSVQVLIWAPQAVTPIHNHKCFCTFAMYQGTLDEDRYTAQGIYKHTATYTPGAMVSLTPDGTDVHRMINTSNDIAISLHFYGINGTIDTSIRTVFKEDRAIVA